MKRGQPDATFHASGKAKMWLEEDDHGYGRGDDEHLAALGYRVRSSDMADVALKLQQLEEAMVSSTQGDGLTHLSSDTVHYNPSDLSTWLQSMLSELGTPFDFEGSSLVPPLHNASAFNDHFLPSSVSMNFNSVLFEDSSSSDQFYLGAITDGSGSGNLGAYENAQAQGPALTPVNSPQLGEPPNKRLKSEETQMSEMTRSVVLVDSQENGVRLVHMLMACAHSVQQDNLVLAEALAKQIGVMSVSQAGAMGKVATYFAEALARRIIRIQSQGPVDHPSFSDAHALHMHFYEACPYLKFAHFTANQAILETFKGKARVHVIDFSMNQGLQWPALLQALARQPGGPPTFRLTAIGPSLPDNTDRLQDVGWKLAQLAENLGVEFEYQGFVANSLADLGDTLRSRISEKETVAFNSVFELHKCLARPGAIEKVLSLVRRLKPEIFTVVEQEGDHNGAAFLDRFNESLHYYSAMFDSLEGSAEGTDRAMTELYLGKEICNVVGSDGSERVERHERLGRWKERLGSAGFEPVPIGSNAYKQVSVLLGMSKGWDGYRVEEIHGCLTLGWHTRPLVASSAWRPKLTLTASG